MIAAAQPTTIPPIAPPERPELEELELEFELVPVLVGWEVVVLLVLVAVWWSFVPAVLC